jgi:phage terminase small subunit
MPTEQSDQARAALQNLEPRQRKFVEAFCLSLNATKAAITAGYSKKTARSIGSENLTKPDIKKAVVAVLSTSAMEPEEIAARWTAMARAGLSDFFTKVEYQHTPRVQRPLLERIAELEYQYDFEERVAKRQNLTGEEYMDHMLAQQGRRNKIVRCEVELEMNPTATYETDGDPLTQYRMELDLVKANELGLFDLVKSIVPTQFGTKVELRSPDEALNNLAKYRQMLTSKVDVTSKGERITGFLITDVTDDDSDA